MVRIFDLKKITVFSVHGASNLDRRHLTAFKAHDPTPMGKFRIPCDVVMQTFMAGDGHSFWFLDTGRWHLSTACSISRVGVEG